MTMDEEYLNDLLRSLTAGMEIDGLEEEYKNNGKREDSGKEKHTQEEVMEEKLSMEEKESIEEKEPIEEKVFMENEENISSDFEANLDEISSLLENADNNDSIADFLKFTDASELEDIPSLSDMRNVPEESEEPEKADEPEKMGNPATAEPFFVGESTEGTDIFFENESDKYEEEKSEKGGVREAKKEAKKAEKEARKAEKAAKKAEKEARKAEQAAKKGKRGAAKEEKEAETDSKEQDLGELNPNETNSAEDVLEGFQNVNEFDDIGALFESINAGNFDIGEMQESEVHVGMDSGERAKDIENSAAKENVPKEKKSLLQRFIDFLMEEDEEETPDNGKEEEKKATDKKEKGKKQKDKKKGKGDKEAGEEEQKKENKQEKKKNKKEKKKDSSASESEIKNLSEEKVNEKKIGRNSIIAAVLLAVSVFAVVMIANSIFSPVLAKQRAQKAFEQKDFKACYQELFGWKLNRKEEEMQAYCLVVLKMERRLDAYEHYKELRQKAEALDTLLRAVQNYDAIYQEALNCGAEREVEERYREVISILEAEYGLDEKTAGNIVALSSDKEYTRCLNEVIKGSFVSDFREEEELPGLLPEEEELPDRNFLE